MIELDQSSCQASSEQGVRKQRIPLRLVHDLLSLPPSQDVGKHFSGVQRSFELTADDARADPVMLWIESLLLFGILVCCVLTRKSQQNTPLFLLNATEFEGGVFVGECRF